MPEQPDPADGAPRAVHLDDLDAIPIGAGAAWRPVRRALGATSIGINAFVADAGQELIERHDESRPGAGGHEEVYFVASGHARFAVDGRPLDAPAGTFVLVPVGVERLAVAERDGTTVVVVGGRPGAALPVSAFEHWYAAEPAYRAGDHRRAIEIASAGLVDHPDNGTLRYQLACYRALAGDREAAIEDLLVAVAGDPRARGWAQDDRDLDAIRDDPRFPAA